MIAVVADSGNAGGPPLAGAKTADRILARAVRKPPTTPESRHQPTARALQGADRCRGQGRLRPKAWAGVSLHPPRLNQKIAACDHEGDANQ